MASSEFMSSCFLRQEGEALLITPSSSYYFCECGWIMFQVMSSAMLSYLTVNAWVILSSALALVSHPKSVITSDCPLCWLSFIPKASFGLNLPAESTNSFYLILSWPIFAYLWQETFMRFAAEMKMIVVKCSSLVNIRVTLVFFIETSRKLVKRRERRS